MKEKKIRIIVGLMTLSVIGLIALQLFWIKNLIKIEEERFARSVNNALISTSEKLEKQEAAKFVFNKITSGKNNVVVLIQGDSAQTPGKKIIKTTKPLKIIREDSASSGEFGYHVTYIDTAADNKKIEIIEKHTTTNDSKSRIATWDARYNAVTLKRDQLVHSVVTELASENATRKIEERISQKAIDSLLSRELANNGINAEYFFAVNKLKSDSLTLIKRGADINMLRKSNFKAALFPGELFWGVNLLVVYFPNEKSLIFSSIAGMLGLSALLILIIAGVFYKTIQMFIRQKKITEIKNDLINNITHEFKTPISTISIACEALIEPALSKTPGSVNKYSGIIREENERLRMMVDNLLDAAAMESKNGGKYNLVKEMFSLDKSVKGILQKFDEPLKQRSGKIKLEGFPTGIKLNADKFHIENILGNLIDNAIKYCETNPEIELSAAAKENSIFIFVRDNGIGIPKSHHKKIFDTFYRVPTGNTHNVRGNGIGLSYAKKIAEAHGGSISVESSPGKGSVFILRIPLNN